MEETDNELNARRGGQFFGRGISLLAFLILAILIVSAWVLYFFTVVPFLKSNGILPTAFFMNWRFPGELEAYAQLRQAQGIEENAIFHCRG